MSRGPRLAAALGTLLLSAPPLAAASPAELDGTFGSGGTLVRPLPAANPRVLDAVPGPGGTVLVGFDAAGPGVARLTPAGAFDPSFGSGGATLTSVTACSTTSFGSGFARAPDGRLLVAVACSEGGVQQLAVARFTAGGALDTSFNPGGAQPGVALVDVAGETSERATAVAALPDGSVILGGQTTSAMATEGEFVFAKLTAAGALDPSYNPGGAQPGVRVARVGGFFPSLNDVAVLPGGGVVGAGVGQNVIALVRVTAQGALDPSFNPTGPEPGVAQVDLPAFGFEALNGIELDGTGIVGAGMASDAGVGFLARFRADASLDPGFGSGGVATLDRPGDFGNLLFALARQRDGRWLVGGYSDHDSDLLGVNSRLLLARFSATGAIDPSFQPAGPLPGSLETNLPGGEGVQDSGEEVQALIALTDGRVLALGNTTPTVGSSDSRLALARYLTDRADIGVTLSARRVVRPGTRFSVTATLANAGPDAADGVALSGGGFEAAPAIGGLAAGAGAERSVTATAGGGRSHVIAVSARSTTADLNIANNSATLSVRVDGRAPRVRVRLDRTRLKRLLARGRLPLIVRASEAARLALVARDAPGRVGPSARREVLARGRLRLRKAGRKRVSLRLTRPARRALTGGATLRVRLRVSARDTAGNRRARTTRLRVSR